MDSNNTNTNTNTNIFVCYGNRHRAHAQKNAMVAFLKMVIQIIIKVKSPTRITCKVITERMVLYDLMGSISATTPTWASALPHPFCNATPFQQTTPPPQPTLVPPSSFRVITCTITVWSLSYNFLHWCPSLGESCYVRKIHFSINSYMVNNGEDIEVDITRVRKGKQTESGKITSIIVLVRIIILVVIQKWKRRHKGRNVAIKKQ